MCIVDIFKHLKRSNKESKVLVSYLEIYGENVFDLLTNLQVPLMLNENEVKNLSQVDVNSYTEAIYVL